MSLDTEKKQQKHWIDKEFRNEGRSIEDSRGTADYAGRGIN